MVKKKKKGEHNGKFRPGLKITPGSKKRENKRVVMFDEEERQEFLTGFHKRKLERRKAAVLELENKLREERKRVREERHKEYIKMLKERREALEEADELEDVITATTESVHYDHPNHTVTVTTISDLDLSSSHLLETLTSSNTTEGRQSEDEKEDDGEDTVGTVPRKAGRPLLSKKIQSLSTSLHTFTKQKKRNRKKELRGQGRHVERKSAVVPGNKLRFGRTTKKQRRQRTGKKGRGQD
ncbi:nucleolar protein 12 [Electrophorus electricus]|uniref:Nucleolar protein 12 n=1 Tax=Electrophorus electricus TaxID=8005 RepID=A0A4W4DNF0_ELEEL|nr:nucleolar protein 12 [Electrophorus electricus]